MDYKYCPNCGNAMVMHLVPYWQTWLRVYICTTMICYLAGQKQYDSYQTYTSSSAGDWRLEDDG